MTDLFDGLSRDHREIERLFVTYADGGDELVAHDICDALTLHSEVEEQVLYPEVRRIVDGGDDIANDAETEHAGVRALIARVHESPPLDLRALMDALRRNVASHVESEEHDIFHRLRESGIDAEALGRKADASRGEASSRSSGQVG